MVKSNYKGVTLIELLVVLALLAVVSPLIFSNLIYGIDTYSTYTKYLEQQDKINEVIQYLRKDIEESSACKPRVDDANNKIELEFPDGRPVKYWLFEGNALKVQIGGGTPETVVDGLDASTVGSPLPTPPLVTSLSRFAFDSNQKRLILIIQPKRTNIGKHEERNVNQPITTEISVKYKQVSPTVAPTTTPAPLPVSTPAPTETPAPPTTPEPTATPT